MKLRVVLPVLAGFVIGSLVFVANTEAAGPVGGYRVTLPMVASDSASGAAAPTQPGGGAVQSPTPVPTATPDPEDPEAPPTPTPTGPDVPGVAYCGDASMPADGRLVGTIMLNGVPAPVGLELGLTFDGVIGPSYTLVDEGFYEFEFYVGVESDCINRPGSMLGVWFAGVSLSAEVTAQAAAGEIPYTFDIVWP